jgi:DNA polymerase-4
MDAVWAQRPKLANGVRPFLVGVTLTRLEHAADHTPSLFATAPARRAALLRATDALNKIYGSGAIYWATAHEARASAPMRIAFNRIPNMVLEMEGSQPKRRKKAKPHPPTDSPS